ncbi:methyltransferase domain-containing protein [Patescibacteria group bacterium]|nr:methyltransferase domain-containing protein [Patescibacteria group bacterium]
MIFKDWLQSLVINASSKCIKDILEFIDFNPNAKILDLGCDTGDLTKLVAERASTKNIFGIDIIKDRYKKAKEAGIKIIESNLDYNFPFVDSIFDILISNQVIEHIHNLDNFMCESFRILRKGGYFICSTENLSSWHNIFALFLGFQPFSITNISVKGVIGNPLALHQSSQKGKEMRKIKVFQHTRVLGYQGLKDIFEKHGFKVQASKASGYYPMPNYLAKLLSSIDQRHAAFITIKAQKI